MIFAHPFLASVSVASVRLARLADFSHKEINTGGAAPVAADIGEGKQTVHCTVLNRVEKHNIV